MKEELDFWKGGFGDEYHKRNYTDSDRLNSRIEMWDSLLTHIEFSDIQTNKILEVGAGVGINLNALNEVNASMNKDCDFRLYGVEPNDYARGKLAKVPNMFDAYNGSIDKLPYKDNFFDLVFTSGVLIHVHPDERIDAMRELHRVANDYIISIEYFAPTNRPLDYRGNQHKLWAADFGWYWQKTFNCDFVHCEFFWKHSTGLDNMTAWIFRKGDE